MTTLTLSKAINEGLRKALVEAPVLRVGGFSAPYPPSRLEDHYLPDLDRVLDAVDRTFAY